MSNRRKRILEQKTENKNIPAAYVQPYKQHEPEIFNHDEITTVKHKEMFAVVSGSTDFKLRSFPINPGNAELFPWLAIMAQSWEHYSFDKLHVEYQPVVGTTESGLVALAPDYNPAEPEPTTMADMLVSPGATRSQVFVPQRMKVNPGKMGLVTRWKYVLHRGEFNESPAVYDAGLVQLAVEGASQDLLLGHLFVTYTVRFQTPQIDVPIQPASGLLTASHAASAPLPMDGSISSPHWTPIINTLGAVYDDVTKEWTIPPGTYNIKSFIPLLAKSTTSDTVGWAAHLFELMADGVTIHATELKENVEPNSATREIPLNADVFQFFSEPTRIRTDRSGTLQSGPTWTNQDFGTALGGLLAIVRLADSAKTPLPE